MSPMPGGSSRRRCARLIKGLDIPDPFDLEIFLRRVEQHRGRPIVLMPLPLTGLPCGLWFGFQDKDYILYAPTPSKTRHYATVLHEVGHMLLDHSSRGNMAHGELLRALLPDLDPDVVERILARASYTTPEEQQAEMFSSMILAQTTFRMDAVNNPDAHDDVYRINRTLRRRVVS